MSEWKIYVDTREPKELLEIFKEYDDFDRIALDSGDYALYLDDDAYVGVERKTVADLVSSIINKRIFDQMERMNKEYKLTILAISGSLEDYVLRASKHGHKINIASILGSISSILVRTNTSVLWLDDDIMLTECIFRIFKKVKEGKFNKDRSDHIVDMYSRDVKKLIMIPGITVSIAKDLLERFGSLERIADDDITIKNIKEINGVGNKKAEKIKKYAMGA